MFVAMMLKLSQKKRVVILGMENGLLTDAALHMGARGFDGDDALCRRCLLPTMLKEFECLTCLTAM